MPVSWIADVNSQVYRQFPELKGVSPSIQAQGKNHLLIYQALSRLPDGKTIQRFVRAVIDDSGKIVKITTSR